MNKILLGVIALVIAGLLIVFKINVVEKGCCKVVDGCADGQGVTQEYCLEELRGTWNVNTICNTDNGNCE